jgi:lipoate-protein ligase A
MFLINNNNITDPSINLALEEYCLRSPEPDKDYFLLYINAPCIIVGKHQNIFQEVNWEYSQKNGIRLIRRISGGGAVYHDQGNLNFSFITGFKKQKWDGIHQLAGEKYQSWDWTYGHSPEFVVRYPLRYNSYIENARIRVKQGLVKSVYPEDGEIHDTVISDLIGNPYNPIG